MLDFFNALSDLIKSDLVKNNIVAIVVIIVGLIVFFCVLTWIVCTKVFLHIKLNQAADKERQYDEIQAKVQELEKRNKELTERLRIYDFERAVDYDEKTAFEDSALDQFKRRKK
jgi:flagellar biosynthesis/type III secretory pathway M-ring protein FliF/YscJ